MGLARYTLMNKNTPVLGFEYDLDAHQAVRVTRIDCREAAPIGVGDRRGDITKHDVNYWWRHRAIPASRAQIDRLLANLQLDSTLVLAEKSFGLSLSDRYWLNDEDHPQTWEAINFFDNDFSDDLGFLTLGQDGAGSSPDAPDYTRVSLSSPSSTLGGDLLKKWKIVDGKRVLLKAGVGAFNQEPYNEVAATALHERLMAPGEFTPYRLFVDGRRVYSACDNMLGPDEELVAAWDVIHNAKQPNNLSDLQFYVHRCERLGLDGAQVFTELAKMFAADFVLANRDRHYRNFGVIRNVETLEVVRLAPVFDSGSCLWSNVELLELPADFDYVAKPFKLNGMKPADQVRLFEGHFEWFSPSMLDGYPEQLADILSRNPNIPERRIRTVVEHVERKIEVLCAIAA
ncbi:excisionase [Eggerthellaceae bacterium zg-887]|uniref:excisionase n=1 Tax=Xiamenia xianingshaonis TaxID=2682776 RepID=UPI00140B9CC0|nr:excisionase [Xiamenia xianingshaonis]NHM15964.1 excisionase [Xiamenia xianingshaonis]